GKGLVSHAMGVIRSWQCLNAACSVQFESWDANPTCPDCGNLRVNWIPGGGHCAGTAKGADAELRVLADAYGLSNLNSAERGRQGKVLTATPAHALNAPQKQFAPGFSSPIMTDAQGRPVATCLPSSAGVTHKVTASIGNRLSGQMGTPGPEANARVEARHTG